ncbi:Predicted lipid-binding transport protein, Tim44 family [Palleronia marisminoris]|uniref:Tim44-like domain protein n=1 Tax=Palleronia marisminoris TaxID=315423 RepID=A0A1Y5SY60_9RHOB|nr:Tim44/TimA family putative adaptor protein [Palleronia marisminoris]SFH06540.1 Predicted lipid-binding transport protein, Tim44 family [Palleronia marisminoris]SLN51421.1 Tim44-like domain protein [Palleronia marisminoris]
MSNSIIQLLVLLGIAIFLILRLKNVLGTRDGFEKPPVEGPRPSATRNRPEFEVIEGGPDRDITDHVDDGSENAKALAAMKMAEPSFNVTEFLSGARQAYEMIFLAFERGDISEVREFLDPDVAAAFDEVIAEREAQGLTIESEIVGVRDVELYKATFDRETRRGEVTVRFLAELTTVVRNAGREIVEGSPTEIKRQRDTWTFAREMGADDPNWQLVATGA